MRSQPSREIGETWSPENLIQKILESKELWEKIMKTAERIMKRKEDDLREQENR